MGHENILKLDRRPFADVEEMEETILRNWNGRVKKNDYVYILGDFIWGGEEKWLELTPRFQGRKVLIQGNHDLRRMSLRLRSCFTDIRPYREISDRRRRVILCHYPILMYNGSFDRSTYMLCGHVHITRENDLLEDFKEIIRRKAAENGDCGPQGQIYNTGCMTPWMDYTPRTLDEIITGCDRYKKRRQPMLPSEHAG